MNVCRISEPVVVLITPGDLAHLLGDLEFALAAIKLDEPALAIETIRDLIDELEPRLPRAREAGP